MSLPRNPLLINVGFLINQPVGSRRDISLEYDHLLLPPDLEVVDFKGNLRCTRTRQGILTNVDFVAKTQLECVRCLENYLHLLHVSFNELFAFDSHSVTDSGLILRDDANIDLSDLVSEYALLELPIRPLCQEDCKGLCTICGNNLNLGLCNHDNDPETATKINSKQNKQSSGVDRPKNKKEK